MDLRKPEKIAGKLCAQDAQKGREQGRSEQRGEVYSFSTLSVFARRKRRWRTF